MIRLAMLHALALAAFGAKTLKLTASCGSIGDVLI